MIGTWHATVLDCKNPSTLASFYQELLGMIRVQDEEDGSWVSIGDAPDRPALAFQRSEDYLPTTWPEPEVPQQGHLDVRVADLDIAETEVLAIGATLTGRGTASYRVYLDPEGHPFCLVAW